jgi:predicted RNA-binding Zn-ribbon protein involved in translation (DUF1610 family)
VPTRSRAANVQAHNKAINAVRCIGIILPILGLSGVGGAEIFEIRGTVTHCISIDGLRGGSAAVGNGMWGCWKLDEGEGVPVGNFPATSFRPEPRLSSRIGRCCLTLRHRQATIALIGDLEVYCPKCGDELEQADGVWLCRRGDMPLSSHVAQRLLNVYVRKVRDSVPKPRLKWGGDWWCPGCGRRLSEEDGLVECKQCRQSLNEFLYELIEVHPHRTHGGLWT